MNKKLGKVPAKSNPKASKVTSNTKEAVPNKGQSNTINKMGANKPKLAQGPNSIDKGGLNKAGKAGYLFEEKKADPQSIKRRKSIANNCKDFTKLDTTLKYYGYQGCDKLSDCLEIYYPKEKGYLSKRMRSPFIGDFIIHDHYAYVFGSTLVRVDINGYCSDVVNMNKQINKYRAGLCSDSNGIIYYLCGLSKNQDAFDKNCEKYNTATDTWTNLPIHSIGGQSLCVTSKGSLYLLLTESNDIYKLPFKSSETAQWEKVKIDTKIENLYYSDIQFINPNRVLIIKGTELKNMQLYYYNEDTHKSGKLDSSKKNYWVNYLAKQNGGLNIWNAHENHGNKKWNFSYLPHQLLNILDKKPTSEVWESAVGKV